MVLLCTDTETHSQQASSGLESDGVEISRRKGNETLNSSQVIMWTLSRRPIEGIYIGELPFPCHLPPPSPSHTEFDSLLPFSSC